MTHPRLGQPAHRLGRAVEEAAGRAAAHPGRFRALGWTVVVLAALLAASGLWRLLTADGIAELVVGALLSLLGGLLLAVGIALEARLPGRQPLDRHP